MNLNLDNFILEEYSEYNKNHKEVIKKLECDKNSKKYLGNINYMITRIKKRYEENKIDKFYIAIYNDYEVGFISLSNIDDNYEIGYGILPEYRKQNLGALLLQEFTDKVFEMNLDINKLILRIEESNIGSKSLAELAGYVKESDTIYSDIRR